MAQPYIGEIQMFGGDFAPVSWAQTNGQLLAISQNDLLFNLIGTTYGGDAVNTFALPDLRSRMPMHQGQGAGLSSRVVGDQGGVESVTLRMVPIPSSPAAPVSASAGFRPQLASISPFCVVNFIIALQGIFPTQN
jgi:microcystin-dependent protein